MNQITYGFNSKYLTKTNIPWFPVMGEFHYSRYPKKYWKESIYKMKAGGVDVISTYVFWIHHEEIENQFDFTGQRDLRTFVEVVKGSGLTLMLRIGPWCHGEARNGGFPDWLLQKNCKVRTNDEKYLEEVRKFYSKIYEQVEGLFYKDGGPIIGVQIENEYGHCGGLNGEEGEEHMRTLTAMAKEIGFIVPYYTATGWGGSATGGLLPVMGGYCEAPWDQRLTEIEPNVNYIFKHERNDHNIGSDHGVGTGLTYDLNQFPFLTAELGGGLQVTHHRRPVPHSKDIGAMAMVKLGSGVNLLGFYMYHGGTNPKGKKTTLQESRATGYLNDLPEYSYDFAAPIREYGQMSETLKELKMLAMFLKDFGSVLCLMDAFIPKSSPLLPNNFTDLRTSVRRYKDSGYLFINNYQRRRVMADHLDVTLEVELETGVIQYPKTDILDKDFYFYPFHMKIGKATLKTALATPLCVLRNHSNTADSYIFYTDKAPQYDIEGDLEEIKIITLAREEAKNAWKMKWDREYLVVTQGAIIESDCGYDVISRCQEILKVYPALPGVPKGYQSIGTETEFALYLREEGVVPCLVEYELIQETATTKLYEIKIDYSNIKVDKINDCFIKIDFAGDSTKLYVNGTREGDWFYTGKRWEIGLKRFDFPETIVIEIEELKEKAECFLETWPKMSNGRACEMIGVAGEYEYRNKLECTYMTV